jgi:choice-of-anchor B domain-containing protein
MMSFRQPPAVLVLGAAIAVLAGAEGAAAQISSNVTLRSNWNLRSSYNDCWGYTAPNGDEYALLGMYSGTSVINITDPDNPYETMFFSGPGDTWQDIKTYQHYAYSVNEDTGGLTIIDLADPENPVKLPSYPGFSSAHNIYVDVSTARLYTAGADVGSAGGTRILSLADPEAPVEVGSWETAYFHDVMVQNGRLYGSAIYAGTLYVLDVSNPASIQTLGTIKNYPNAFTHNAWVTADDGFVMTTDETTGAACRLWDITVSAKSTFSASLASLYLPNPATIPHNTHIDGNIAVISHYTLGVRIVDITDPYNITEAGYYDTYPASDGGGYSGCWGAFPFFGTNQNLIIASDQTNGLFVLEYGSSSPTSAPAPAAAAGAPLLGTAAPNPFRAGSFTSVDLSLSRAGEVTGDVFDAAGRRVAALGSRHLEPGVHGMTWDGRTEGGRLAPAGVYFLRARTPEGEASRKVVLNR